MNTGQLTERKLLKIRWEYWRRAHRRFTVQTHSLSSGTCVECAHCDLIKSEFMCVNLYSHFLRKTGLLLLDNNATKKCIADTWTTCDHFKEKH